MIIKWLFGVSSLQKAILLSYVHKFETKLKQV